MYIHEAVKRALETGKRFSRPGLLPHHELELNSPNSYGTITIQNPATGKYCPLWHPKHGDLIADDWVLVE